MSPKLEHDMERLNFNIQMSQFDPAKHLKEREEQYIALPYCPNCEIFVVRETEEGWWRENINFAKDLDKQIQEHKNDPTIAVGWFSSPRFRGNGGWS